MISSLPTPVRRTTDALFPIAWLLSEPIEDRINRAATGVGLFEAVRHPDTTQATYLHEPYPSGPITDFRYVMVNPVLEAMARVTKDDCLSLPLSALIPESVKTTLIGRMAQVVQTGLPQHYNDVFTLDGVVAQHDQLCLKAGDGVLVLVMDVTYLPLTNDEQQRRADLLDAILTEAPVDLIRQRLLAVMT